MAPDSSLSVCVRVCAYSTVNTTQPLALTEQRRAAQRSIARPSVSAIPQENTKRIL